MARWSRFELAADRRLVKGLTAGSGDALAKLYDIYAERLFDYCWSSLGDVRNSANIVHDTLIDAYRRAGRMRDRDRLRAWLYAAARRRCIQQRRGGGALTWECAGTPGGSAGHRKEFEPADSGANPRGTARTDSLTAARSAAVGAATRTAKDAPNGRGSGTSGTAGPPESFGSVGERAGKASKNGASSAETAGKRAAGVAESCKRVRKAFHRLPVADQEAIFLAARHDLDVADLAVTLGESHRRVQSRLARSRAWLSEALPTMDPSTALDQHGAPQLPPELRNRVLHAGSDPELAGYRNDIVARAGALSPDGFPRQPDSRSPLARRWLLAATGLGAAFVAVASVLMMLGPPVPGTQGQWPFESVPAPKPSKSVPDTAPQPPENPTLPPPPGEVRPGDRDEIAAPAKIEPNRPSAPPTYAARAKLVVRPNEINLGGYSEAKIRLRAENGTVDWTARDNVGAITLSRTYGSVSAGDEDTIVVGLNRALITLPGFATITVTESDGREHSVYVSWSASLL